MIRMIFTDLDGTLLEPDGTLPDGIFEAVEALHALGIRFAAASGRQLGNLRRLFAPVSNMMDFVCENGAVNALEGEVIGVIPIPREMGLEMITDLENAGMNLLISGRHTTYLVADNRAYADDIVYRLRNTSTIVNDLRAIPEPFLKISGQISEGLERVAPDLLTKWKDRVTATVSGRDWFDFTLSNKGMGVGMLMKRLGLERGELAAFGDNFNDESMLDLVGHPFLMEHANPALRKPGVRLCKKVLPVLEEIISQKGLLV